MRDQTRKLRLLVKKRARRAGALTLNLKNDKNFPSDRNLKEQIGRTTDNGAPATSCRTLDHRAGSNNRTAPSRPPSNRSNKQTLTPTLTSEPRVGRMFALRGAVRKAGLEYRCRFERNLNGTCTGIHVLRGKGSRDFEPNSPAGDIILAGLCWRRNPEHLFSKLGQNRSFQVDPGAGRTKEPSRHRQVSNGATMPHFGAQKQEARS